MHVRRSLVAVSLLVVGLVIALAVSNGQIGHRELVAGTAQAQLNAPNHGATENSVPDRLSWATARSAPRHDKRTDPLRDSGRRESQRRSAARPRTIGEGNLAGRRIQAGRLLASDARVVREREGHRERPCSRCANGASNAGVARHRRVKCVPPYRYIGQVKSAILAGASGLLGADHTQIDAAQGACVVASMT